MRIKQQQTNKNKNYKNIRRNQRFVFPKIFIIIINKENKQKRKD